MHQTPPIRPSHASGAWRALLALVCWVSLGAAPAPPAKVDLQLKWQHQFQFAGYYAAQEQGYYRDAGLEVAIHEAGPGIDAVQEVVSGRAQFGVGSSALLLSRQQGLPVVVLAAVFQHSPFILMAKAGTGITAVQDFVGKRVMIEPHADELVAYLRKEGVSEKDMTLLPQTFNPMDLIDGKVDGMSAYVTDEPFFLKRDHHEMLEFSPRMGGIDFYGDNLFTSEAELKAHPAQVKAFRDASMKGWKYAMQHPDELVELITSRYGERRGRAYLRYEALKMVSLLQPSLVEMGYMYPGRWQHIVDTYAELGLLPRNFKLEGFLYDPEANARQEYRALTRAIAALVALGGLLGGTVLIFLRLNMKLKGEIASREQAEETLRQEHEQAERYLRVAEVILLALDSAGRVTMLNRKGLAVLGYGEGELNGLDWFQTCLAPEDRDEVRQLFHRVLAGEPEMVVFGENEVLCRDGSRRLIAWHDSPLTDAQGRVTGTLSSGEDITERKRAERDKTQLQAQLQQAQKMESIGSLAGGIAHDMNNVLGAILGMASAHLENQPAGSPAWQAFNTIIRAAERGGKMVKSLLSFARMTPSQDQEVDLNALLQEETNLLEHTTLSKVRLELDLAQGLRPILGDAGALNHAFMNICINAVDAMPGGGALAIRTCNVDPDHVEVQVRDTGTGMTPEVMARALDPFYTTKPQGKGTGLGLSMVYSTVQAHGGTLTIQSEPGRGTRVTVRFPACELRVPAPAAAALDPLPAARKTLTVLLVDDDDLVRSSMESVLEELGHAFVSAASGEQGLQALDEGFRPDLVIMDMNMPGWGGEGTLPRLRPRYPDLPVLLATGRADQAARDLLEAYPPAILLPKPFTLKELQGQIQALLNPAKAL